MMYLLYSHKHGGWWCAAGRGYTTDQNQAGLYKADEARAICEKSALGWFSGWPPTVMIEATGDPAKAAERVMDATQEALRAKANDTTRRDDREQAG